MVKFGSMVLVSGHLKAIFILWTSMVGFDAGFVDHMKHLLLFKGLSLEPLSSILAEEAINFGIDGTRYGVICCYGI